MSAASVSFAASDGATPFVTATASDVSISANETTVSNALYVDGTIVVDGGISSSGDLSVEASGQVRLSASSGVTIDGGSGHVEVRSTQGDVTLEAFGTLTLKGDDIQVDASDFPADAGDTNKYTLCMCGDGTLFRVAGSATCSSATTVC